MKKFLAMMLALCMVLALCACGSSPAPANSQEPSQPEGGASDAPAETQAPAVSEKLTFTTGGDTGTYYGFGSVLAQYVSSNTGVSVTAVVGNGSQANIEDLDSGAVQLGFCQSDVMSYAYSGTNLFADSGKVDSFSVVAALYMEQVQIVTMNPDVKTVEDLRGKSVSIGARGSGVYFNAIDVLSVYGMTVDDINPVYQSFGDSADSLKDGKIDAAFIVAGAPTTAITDLSTGGQVYLVSIDDEHISQLIEKSPYYSAYTVPAATYNLPEDCQTVAIGAVVLARDDVSEDAIYAFVSTIFENAGDIQHGKAEELDLAFASSITDVPYHPGAAKYFAEKGIEVPVK